MHAVIVGSAVMDDEAKTRAVFRFDRVEKDHHGGAYIRLVVDGEEYVTFGKYYKNRDGHRTILATHVSAWKFCTLDLDSVRRV